MPVVEAVAAVVILVQAAEAVLVTVAEVGWMLPLMVFLQQLELDQVAVVAQQITVAMLGVVMVDQVLLL